MGNHEVGKAMGRMAEMANNMRTCQTALDILDEICEPYRGADAEFDAEDPKNPGRQHPDYYRYTDPMGPLGMLIKEAFDRDTDWFSLQNEVVKSGDDDKLEEFYENWGAGPEALFRARYDFC